MRAAISAFLLLVISASSGNQGKLFPVDEGTKDPSFSAFRERLLRAVRGRDERFILSILDPNIELSFGGHRGIKDFKEMWLTKNSREDLWTELNAVLSLGGAFVTSGGGKQFCAPYTFTNFPDDVDAFEYAAITGNNVRVRARPELSSPIVSTLTYDVVRADFYYDPRDSQEEKGTPGWVKITTPEGRQGYVAARFIRSAVDYRACFRKVKGSWRMTAFIGGD